VTESQLVKIILAHLSKIPGVFAWRQNTGAVRTATGMVRFGIPGQADITGVVSGKRFEIECKSDRGKVSDAQRQFGLRMIECGGLYVVAYVPSDAIAPVCALAGVPCPIGIDP